ncbi:MAG: right-handed parallel beta-helix repeat-containing protein [Planctomycetota bacterium]|jgi:predicted outer membrane repeat protein
MKEKVNILVMLLVALVMVSTATGEIIYVDDDANGSNNGSCWADAYNDLQDVLTIVQYGDEIQVAQGIYTPDYGGGNTPGDRTATFQLKNGVIIKGGYAGFGEPEPNVRDIDVYETILSGDLNGDDIDVNEPGDLLNEPNRVENSYNVVTVSGTDATAILDGFTITGGHAKSYPENIGGGIYNEYGSPKITNCTFTNNFANSEGGGMYNYESNPTVTNCTFMENYAPDGGGMHNTTSNPLLNNCVFIKNTAGVGSGIYNKSSSPVINNCVFIGNSAPFGSGGGIYNDPGSPVLTNCKFIGNVASSGGGISNYYSNPALFNCLFIGNTAGVGGGMTNSTYSDPTLINCTFSANFAADKGGGMYNSSKWSTCRPTLTSSIFWSNSDSIGMGESSQIYRGILTINHCCIQGWTGNWGGTGNFGYDPMFADTYGPDNILGTEDDNLRLLPTSPCIDAGDNSAIPPWMLIDLDGDPRIINATVDIGAYENPKKIFLLNPKPVIVPEGQTATFTVALGMFPLSSIEVTVNCQSGDLDISIASGGILSFDSSNYSEPQTVTLSAVEDTDYLNGETLIWIRAPGFFTAGCVATESDNEPVPTVLYVDGNSGTDGDKQGRNWADAFTELQDALSIAAKYPQSKEVRVAQGTYTPDSNSSDPNGSGDRAATFQLASGVAVKGGYAGLGTPDPNARDIDAYETILSGDLNDDDVDVNSPADLLDEPSRSENSNHVVTGSGTEATAVLDGFTIAGGYTNGEGGGMYTQDGSPTIYNCTFRGNCARDDGGAMAYRNSSSVLKNCTFISNSGEYGGGIYCYKTGLTLTNCTFSGNSTNEGSGPPPPPPPPPPTILSGSSMFTDYVLSNNIVSADLRGSGGGIYCRSSSITLTNCTFSGNLARVGGGIRTYGSHLALTNCTFSGNLAKYGGGINKYSGSLTLTNCILWNDTPDEIDHDRKDTVVTYSNIQGGWGGEGNINTDPLFRDGDGEDDIPGTEDDNLRLFPGSPCIDAGDLNHPYDPNETDLDGRPRVLDGNGDGIGVVDMGAYEFTSIQAKVRISPRSINLTSSSKWITCYIWLPDDYSVIDIDSNNIFLNGLIRAESVGINEEKQVVIARFSREELLGILKTGEVELTITGWLMDGIVFEGKDVIRVMHKPDKYIQASDPNPTDGATSVSPYTDLSWTASPTATSHDVYFGTSSTPPFIHNQTDTTFDPGTMYHETTYYWRIDEVNKWGKTTGKLWSFTTYISPVPLTTAAVVSQR